MKLLVETVINGMLRVIGLIILVALDDLAIAHPQTAPVIQQVVFTILLTIAFAVSIVCLGCRIEVK